LTKVSNPYWSHVERGLYKSSVYVLKSIANALQISAETMYNQAGLLDDDAGTKGHDAGRVEQAIHGDSRLSKDQKETLIRIYRGFTQRT
jgi:hypothetical protein